MAIWKTACYNVKVKGYFRKSLSPWTLYNLGNTVLGVNSIIAINLSVLRQHKLKAWRNMFSEYVRNLKNLT